MFNFFFSDNTYKSKLDFLGIDMHSHLVPNVDDGSTSIDNSLQLIEGLHELGFQRLITTPHIHPVLFKNNINSLSKPFEKLKEKASNIWLSAEYYMDGDFIESLNENDLICFPKNHILVETSFISYDLGLESAIFNLKSLGYKPILAHPERYLYMAKNDLKIIEKLTSMGCEFQLNLNSMMGLYGKSCKEFAERLIERKMVQYLATDLHNLEQLELLKKTTSKKAILGKLYNYPWLNSQLLD